MTADEMIAVLGLTPHPEGGYFCETFRDALAVPDGQATRPASTAIYFLLREGQLSRWHRIDAVEVWHWYAGASLELSIADAGAAGSHRKVVLGANFAQGERPQAIVPAASWQQARSLGAWTLVGCTVAPGFLFERFELAPDNFRPTQPGS